jgi:hypothetical protein
MPDTGDHDALTWVITTGDVRSPKALHVGIFLWHYVFLLKNPTVAVSMTRAASEMGFDRTSAIRGLSHLEAAKLVTVTRASGRRPVVTVLSSPGSGVERLRP